MLSDNTHTKKKPLWFHLSDGLAGEIFSATSGQIITYNLAPQPLSHHPRGKNYLDFPLGFDIWTCNSRFRGLWFAWFLGEHTIHSVWGSTSGFRMMSMSPPLKASPLLFWTLFHSVYTLFFISPSFCPPYKTKNIQCCMSTQRVFAAISASLMVELEMILAPSTSDIQRIGWWHSLCPPVGFVVSVKSIPIDSKSRRSI